MASLSVFDFSDYKTYLHKQIEDNASVRAFQSKLAQAAGCKGPYISRVLNGAVHLTPDHAVGISRFLGLSGLESDYFLELVQLERAATTTLRTRTQTRLEELKREYANLSKRFEVHSLSSESQNLAYYSSWLISAVHMALGISGLHSPDHLATRFGTSREVVVTTLETLESLGLAKNFNGRWSRTLSSLHLPRESALTFMHHFNWRTRCLVDIQQQAQIQAKEALHYTAVHTLAKKDIEVMKAHLTKTIADSRRLADGSKDEKLVCLCLDLFEP